MEVTLTEGEILVVNGIAVGLNAVRKEQIEEIGAYFAVAKALNLYPRMDTTKSVHRIVGRTHARIQVVWSAGYQASYSFPIVWGDTIIVVVGHMPEYFIAGFLSAKMQDGKGPQKGLDNTYHVYGHTLEPLKDSYIFWELINDSWNWQTAYQKAGEVWERKDGK